MAASVTVSDLFLAVEQTPAVQTLFRRVEGEGLCTAGGLSGGAQPFLAALIRQRFRDRPVVIVTEGVKAQERFQQDLETWLRVAGASQADEVGGSRGRRDAGDAAEFASEAPLFFPAWENLPHEAKLPHVDVISERLETLVELTDLSESARTPVVVTAVAALLQRTIPKAMLKERTRRFQRGMQMDPRSLAEWLEEQGYEAEAQVNHKGEFALRGGILDVFSPTAPWPVRMEFFGDDLDSLRHFDPITQVSREVIAEVVIPPAGELGLLKRVTAEPAVIGEPGQLPASLVEYLPAGAIILICEPERVAAQAREYVQGVPPGDPFVLSWEELQGAISARGLKRIEVGESPLEAPTRWLGPEVEIGESAGGDHYRSEESGEKISGSAATLADLGFGSLEVFRPMVDQAPEAQVAEVQRREFFGQMHRWLRQGYGLHVFCNNEGERQRFCEIWEEYGFEKAHLSKAECGAGPAFHLGSLSSGFCFEAGRRVVVTDAEIFGRYKIQRPRRLKSPQAQMTRSALEIDFHDLGEGDYVVHVQHGIGRYVGLQPLPGTGGLRPLEKAVGQIEGGQECLVIEYASADPLQPAPRLYVPVSEAHLVSKYIGAGKAHPPLNSLGGGRWSKTKEAAQHAVQDLAGELLGIQAARDAQAGHAFGPDAPWQREFESAFIYEETPDQMRAIVETKTDMERARPMDRLICGDVGFGKTEVAIRSTFKAVLDGKQVAVLVPTTVLAQQHFNTFRERMADYPVRIELLSRFRTARAQARVLEELAAGAVDVVIGTHRLIQNDVGFKDLGLVIIDEEQRFGVLHKEKFKQLRRLVDVLTLSATPIPRTLYLALTGARDMSTIETPPQDRLPVETIVTAYDERVIRDAIRRELNRQGQVFYLHNRVLDIETVRQRLRQLVPDARLVVGHGQMPADELESVMTRFVNGEADVLLSTTIIESGLDIPNANTIIIDRADRFGLSDLYQLRGRVGRYKHQAYAYLVLPRHAGLLSDARKRIGAIKQYSSLGSGFKIAMRDLEIRGAGNLLGPQQSGHITAVGFELYCQLLKQSISALKGEKVAPRIEVELRLDFLALGSGESAPPRPRSAWTDEQPGEAGAGGPARGAGPAAAFLPVNYIADTRQRVEMYRKLAEATDRQLLARWQAELRDRFGPPPPAAELLLELAGLKIIAAERGVTGIETREDKLMLTRDNDYITTGGKFPRLTRTSARARVREIQRIVQVLR